MSREIVPTDCELRAVELDFAAKQERAIAAHEIDAAVKAGKFVWVDLRVASFAGARQTLVDLEVPAEVIEHALVDDATTQLSRYDGCLHLALTGCRLGPQAGLELSRVDAVIFERLLVTVHRGRPAFLEAVRANYRSDFLRHAVTPSFLIYELWDQLLETYHDVQKKFEDRVEQVQGELVNPSDDHIFQRVSGLGSSLLYFRKVLLPARAVLAELATRRSVFVSEATQAYLANMVGTIEHVLQDLLVDRDILAESLNLYMSVVTHRTNRVMNKLTVVSVIFLPLTFICGIYGMNFEFLPELHWKYAYLGFWLLVVGVVATLLLVLKRFKVL